MILLRTLFILALSLSLNTTMAQEKLDSVTTVQSQAEQEQLPLFAGRKDNRRSGKCGQSPSLWALNICEGNTFCYVETDDISLWREKQPEEGTVQVLVENLDTGDLSELSWGASEPTLTWPTTLVPLISGKAYWIDLKQQEESFWSKEIVLYRIPAEDKATWLKQKGCESQYRMLTEG